MQVFVSHTRCSLPVAKTNDNERRYRVTIIANIKSAFFDSALRFVVVNKHNTKLFFLNESLKVI